MIVVLSCSRVKGDARFRLNKASLSSPVFFMLTNSWRFWCCSFSFLYFGYFSWSVGLVIVYFPSLVWCLRKKRCFVIKVFCLFLQFSSLSTFRSNISSFLTPTLDWLQSFLFYIYFSLSRHYFFIMLLFNPTSSYLWLNKGLK